MNNDATSVAERIEQAYKAYLTAIYRTEYYKTDQKHTLAWARRWDFVIGLAAAMSGGSGLGILADPRLAWVCGTITSLAVVLTVAKAVWDWPGRLKFDADRVQDYGQISGTYSILVDDIQYKRTWSQEFETLFTKLREDSIRIPESPYDDLSLAQRRFIQDGIKHRLDYGKWWRPSQ